MYTLNLYVVNGNKEPLLGREWLKIIKLDWPTLINCKMEVNNISTNYEARNLLQKYNSVLKEGISEIKSMQARLTIKPNVKLIFVKARTVPCALKPKIEEEIENFTKQCVLKKVNSTDWATPIVPVVKANGKSKKCGDFKTTINTFLIVDNHPLPTVNELFSNEAGVISLQRLT